ncbi:MAG: hypothetical protein LPH21_06325 [Shewanella sp.]|nr:hypothetical protein [Shewanella sp.]
MTTRYTEVNTSQTLLSVDLNGLADNATSVQSTSQNNYTSGTRLLLANFYLHLSEQGGNRVAGATVDLYLVPKPTIGGIQAELSVEGDCLENYYAGAFRLDDSSDARTVLLQSVRLPPFLFTARLKNRTGQSFNTNNDLQISSFSYEHTV